MGVGVVFGLYGYVIFLLMILNMMLISGFFMNDGGKVVVCINCVLNNGVNLNLCYFCYEEYLLYE